MLDPIVSKALSLAGNEFSLGGAGKVGGAGGGGAGTGADAVGGGDGGGFGKALTNAIGNLQGSIDQSTAASNALATGQATDVSQVAMTVERAVLELQLATQIRNKGVEAYQEIFRMNV